MKARCTISDHQRHQFVHIQLIKAVSAVAETAKCVSRNQKKGSQGAQHLSITPALLPHHRPVHSLLEPRRWGKYTAWPQSFRSLQLRACSRSWGHACHAATTTLTATCCCVQNKTYKTVNACEADDFNSKSNLSSGSASCNNFTGLCNCYSCCRTGKTAFASSADCQHIMDILRCSAAMLRQQSKTSTCVYTAALVVKCSLNMGRADVKHPKTCHAVME